MHLIKVPHKSLKESWSTPKSLHLDPIPLHLWPLPLRPEIYLLLAQTTGCVVNVAGHVLAYTRHKLACCPIIVLAAADLLPVPVTSPNCSYHSNAHCITHELQTDAGDASQASGVWGSWSIVPLNGGGISTTVLRGTWKWVARVKMGDGIERLHRIARENAPVTVTTQNLEDAHVA